MKHAKKRPHQKVLLRELFRLSWIFSLLTLLGLNFYFLNNWYRIPHKNICYNAQIDGCIGYPSCNIYIGMNYGDNYCTKDSLGCYLIIKHRYKKHSPYLYRGIVDSYSLENRKDRYKKTYTPLHNHYSVRCDSISTVYRTSILLESNLSDVVNCQDKEIWDSEPLLAIRRSATTNPKRNASRVESWFYMSRLPNSFPYEQKFIRLCLYTINTIDNLQPSFLSKGDISKLDCSISLNLTHLLSCDTVTFYSVGPFTSFSANIPPDSISFNKFIFYNKDKIKQLRSDGLRFYAEFPEAQKLQNFRIALLLTVIPIILSAICSIIVHEYKFLKRRCPYILKRHNI